MKTRFGKFNGTVRWRLTSWYTLVLLATFGIFAVTVHMLVSRTLHEQIDQGLQETMSAVGIALDRAYQEENDFTAEHLHEEMEELNLPSDTSLVVRASGMPDYERRTGSLRASPLAVDPGRGLESPSGPATIRHAEKTWRVLTAPVTPAGGPEHLIILARDLTPLQQQLALLRRLFLLSLVPLLATAAAGGYFLAGRVLKPVSRIANQARQIGAHGLEERLAVENPRDEFGRLAQVLNELFSRLDAAFRQQRRLLADAAHELRTPAAILRAHADVALQRPRDAGEYAEALASIRAEAEHLSDIVDDLMFIARADADQMPARREEVDLAEIVDDCCRGVRPLAETKGLSLHWDPGAEIQVTADPRLLRRAVTNVLANAIKHTPQEGIVSVRLEAGQGRAVVEIADSGSGIPAEELPHVFDRFFRGSRQPGSEDEGSGLGLAIVKVIMELHGGSVEARSLPGQGAAFLLHLPRQEMRRVCE